METSGLASSGAGGVNSLENALRERMFSFYAHLLQSDACQMLSPNTWRVLGQGKLLYTMATSMAALTAVRADDTSCHFVSRLT